MTLCTFNKSVKPFTFQRPASVGTLFVPTGFTFSINLSVLVAYFKLSNTRTF